MDLDDIPYRERDFKLRVDEFKQRDRHHEDQRKASISQAWPRFLASGHCLRRNRDTQPVVPGR